MANISTDIYLTMSVPDLSDLAHSKDIHQPLKKVLYYCFGKVNDFSELSVFLFFPWLYDTDYDFIRLSDEVLQWWTDNILLPTIYEYLPSGHTQHVPAS